MYEGCTDRRLKEGEKGKGMVSKYVDGVVLRTGVEVPEPLILPTFRRLDGLSQYTLRELRKIVDGTDPSTGLCNEASKIDSLALRRLQRLELVNSDGSVYPNVGEVIRASTEVSRDNYYVLVNPVPFPLKELVTNGNV